MELYLVPQVEEVAEIVGAQISSDALGLVHFLKVRLGPERVQRAALRVLQRHVDPVEQLSGLVVPRRNGLQGGHHAVFGGAAAPVGRALSAFSHPLVSSSVDGGMKFAIT